MSGQSLFFLSMFADNIQTDIFSVGQRQLGDPSPARFVILLQAVAVCSALMTAGEGVGGRTQTEAVHYGMSVKTVTV